MKDEGSFILNIKERVVNGERHTYVLELILALRKQGWLWTEEYVWHKKNSYPGKWPNRFRDGWELIKLFTKPGDIVLDPFLGSGTTAVAAKQLNREYIGIEIDPTYIHIAQERLHTVQDQITVPQSILEYLESPISEDTKPTSNGQKVERVQIGTFKQVHKKHQLVEQAKLEFS